MLYFSLVLANMPIEIFYFTVKSFGLHLINVTSVFFLDSRTTHVFLICVDFLISYHNLFFYIKLSRRVSFVDLDV